MNTFTKLLTLLVITAVLGLGTTVNAAAWVWAGTSDTNWNNAANWTPSGVDTHTNGTFSDRLEITSVATYACSYTAAQGHTIYTGNGATAPLACAAANGATANGNVIIAGGIWESQPQTGQFDYIAGGGAAGAYATGVLTIAGGTYVNTNAASSGTLMMERAGTNSAILNVNSGTALVNLIGWSYNNGGYNAGSAAVTTNAINLNGGVLGVINIGPNVQYNWPLTINFNGGTLQAIGNAGSFAGFTNGVGYTMNAAAVNVLAGGAVLDSQGFTATTPNGLLHGISGMDGGLTKQGGGSWTISGTNTYNGPTLLQAGTLNILATNTGGGAFTNFSGTTLGVTVTAAGQTLFMSSLTESNLCTNTFNLGALGNPTQPVIYATNLLVPGTNQINITGSGFSVGQFPLIKYTSQSGLTAGSFVAGSLPFIGFISNNVANSSVDVVITQLPYLVWMGKTNGVLTGSWDVNTTSNWFNPVLNSWGYYTNSYNVVFDDTATGTSSVTPATNVSPVSVVFNNTSLTYTLAGTNSLNGAGSLTLSGAGTVYLLTSNNYSGGTFINNGRLVVTNTAIPAGGLANVTLSGGALDVAGNALTLANLNGTGGLVTNSGMATVLTVSNAYATGCAYGGKIVGALALQKIGLGVTTLGGINTYTGGTVVSNGQLFVTSGGALGASGSTIAFAATNSGYSRLALSGGVTVTGQTLVFYGYPVLVDIYGALVATNGYNVWAGPVLIGLDGTSHNARVSALNGATLEISGQITNAPGNPYANLAIENQTNSSGGAGTVVLSNPNNNYGGQTYLYSGTLRFGVANGLPLTSAITLGSGNNPAFAGSLDLNGYNQSIAAIYNATNTGVGIIGNSSTSSDAVLTINGSVDTTHLTNQFNGTIVDAIGSGTHKTSLNLNSIGNHTTVVLTGTNTYTGNTTIANEVLALTGYGSTAYYGYTGYGAIPNTPVIGVGQLGAFDVTGLPAPFVLGSSQTLSNGLAVSGAPATGTIIGSLNASGGTISLSYTNGTPALAVTNGTLTLATGTTFKVNNTGPALAAGSYAIITSFTGGLVSGTAPASVTVGGSGTAGVNSLSISNNDLYLVVATSSVNTNAATANFHAVPASGALNFTWASDHLGWQLYTNAVGLTASGSWFPLAGSGSVTNETIAINPATPSVFFQLRYP